MKCKPFHEVGNKFWDSANDQFYAAQQRLRIYEGGYVTFNEYPERETGRVNWLTHNNCRVGVWDELPVEITSKLCTPDGVPVLKADLSQADLSQGDQQILLCDLDHRIAVALDGVWRGTRNPHATRVYWPTINARPISNYKITVSRANRKRSNAMVKQWRVACDTIKASLLIRRGSVEVRHWLSKDSYDIESLKKLLTGKTDLSEYIGIQDDDRLLRLWNLWEHYGRSEIIGWSRDVTKVEYLKF